ncbi:monovalent cation/H+ antiporter subunit D family protein [Halalkalicoccus sp. NIPERK01]|uniref:monovalent cation/H+ antiporter subunit D family protein n=1 Tax=Halalkalicoccus sp. NIPERK01 TaxID=3053469 RepID=UPI00256EDADC|nr:monovalent cation/H+ antiporter subunit D family protein [Halalkalicoccus sp. NIPERK01]MDL5363745.1 monovalent cation/H+ antiporter subunit D family protein [Halalkalicoccus sp. NIPERK01]
MIEGVPALLVVVPILAATLPLFLGVRYDRAGWSIGALTTTALFALALWLAVGVYTGGTVIHQLGGFPRPIGIELVADRLSALVVVLVAGISAGVLAYTRRGGPRGNSFYSAYLLLVGGLLGLSLTGDVFNMFVFLEITGLTTYALIAKGNSGESAVAALKYLIIGTVGASLYLIGVGFLFLATGTLNMIDLATAIPAAEGGYANPLVLAAFAFVFVGFAIKVALFPLHTWQPDAYQRAPDGVTPMISALVSTVSAYALFRLLYTVFTVEFLVATPYVTEIVVAFGSVSVLAGTTLAVIQTEIKRTLAYSSVSQFGLVVLAYGLANETALIGAIVHLLGHAIMKGGLFLAFGVVAAKTGARTVDEYAGLADRAPVAAGTFAVLGLALVGVPPSIGFVGKWFIAVGAVEAGIWPVAGVVFLSTMLTLAYVARLLEKMYFTPSPARGAYTPESPLATDGGGDDTADPAPNAVSAGMLGVAVLAALLAVALGFAGGVFQSMLGPFVEVVLNG